MSACKDIGLPMSGSFFLISWKPGKTGQIVIHDCVRGGNAPHVTTGQVGPVRASYPTWDGASSWKALSQPAPFLLKSSPLIRLETLIFSTGCSCRITLMIFGSEPIESCVT